MSEDAWTDVSKYEYLKMPLNAFLFTNIVQLHNHFYTENKNPISGRYHCVFVGGERERSRVIAGFTCDVIRLTGVLPGSQANGPDNGRFAVSV